MLCCELDMVDAVLPGPEPLPAPITVPPETKFQCNPDSDEDCCATMIPPSFFAPVNSTCWEWWETPADGVMQAGMVPTKGCDYSPYEAAACACDSYCCDTAWDKSCRGYVQDAGGNEENFFVNGCSAKMLCCELDMVDAVLPAPEPLPAPITVPPEIKFQCNPDSDEDCCASMVPPSFYPPRNSTCWEWWETPMDGILPAGEEPIKGCDYQPCQDA